MFGKFTYEKYTLYKTVEPPCQSGQDRRLSAAAAASSVSSFLMRLQDLSNSNSKDDVNDYDDLDDDDANDDDANYDAANDGSRLLPVF